jgi:hypothetical protein
MQIPSHLNYTQAFAGPFRPTPPGTVVQVTPLLGLGGPFPGNAGPFVTPPTGYAGFGADPAPKTPVAVVEPVKLVPVTAPKVPAEDTSGTLHTLNKIAGYAGYLGGAFHGYKRTESVGWAFGWALFGGLIWPLAIPVMFAQGFGKPIAKTAIANRKASKNGQRISIKTLADAMAYDHINDPLVGSTVEASDVDMFEDRILRTELREHGFGTGPKNVEKLRMELQKSLARAEQSNR